MQLIASNPETSVFASILEKTGYAGLLSGDKSLTVFAPANSAFQHADLNMDDLDALRELVKNHLAYAGYTILNGSFTVGSIELLNAKHAATNNMQINGVDLLTGAGQYNLSASNGILHLLDGVIPNRKNIWEYLQAQPDNWQARFIQNMDVREMDREKSVQIGVDQQTGRPVYDTVWINRNPFLEEYPIDNESQHFTYALLPNDVISRIETKYGKYFARPVASQQDSVVRAELIKDCILLPVTIDAGGRYLSVNEVLMDIDASHIVETYTASNGIVYKLSDADVKIYDNKVKPILIEAEDYFSVFADGNAWYTRYREVASGEKDLVMNTRITFVSYAAEDTITYTNIHGLSNPDENLSAAVLGVMGRVNNCYAEYKQVVHSVHYKMYWKSYDDVSWHSDGSRFREPIKYSQKLLLSLPDQPVVYRASDANIINNFSATSAFTSTRIVAGEYEEKQLFRCLLSANEADAKLFMLGKNAGYDNINGDENDYFTFFTGSDESGDKETIVCPGYGTATFLVANTTEYKTNYSGMLFLDYIKLVPMVDPND